MKYIFNTFCLLNLETESWEGSNLSYCFSWETSVAFCSFHHVGTLMHGSHHKSCGAVCRTITYIIADVEVLQGCHIRCIG